MPYSYRNIQQEFKHPPAIFMILFFLVTFPAILPHQFILTHPFRKSAWRDHDALPNLFSSSFRNRCKVISADKMATRKQGTNSPSCSYAELATTPIDCAFIHSAAECGSEINTISGEVCREPLHPQPVILNSPSQRRSLMINSPCKPTHFDRFKMGLKRLLDHSTVHGLSHVSTAKSRLGRAAWFCLWLAGLTGFIFNMALIVERYISCPVLINNIEDYETFEWPDLTFCNPTTPYVLQNPEIKAKWLKLVEKARQTVDNLPRHEIFKELDQFEWSEIAVQTLVFSTISADEFRIGLVNEMLHFAAADVGRPGIALSMEENGKLIYLHSPLSDYAYTQFIQKRFNIPCITFQLSRGLSKSELAKVEKVAFGINYNYDSYLLINSSYVSHSIYMFITPKGHEPAGDGHKFYPGYGNHITVSMRRTIKHHKKEPCRLTEYTVEVFGADLVSRHNSTGQAEFCHRIVSQKLYVERCGCYNPYLPFPVLNIKSGGPPPICFNMTLFSIHELAENERCMHTLYGEFRNVSHYLSLPEARHCEHFRIMTECNTRTYVIEELYRERMIELWTQSYNDARAAFLRQSFMDTSPDADKIMQLLAKNTTNEQNEYMFARLRQNFGLLTIRRDQAHGILVSEELEYPLSELLSDVGGLMGLWVGISVVGLFEFIELAGLIIVTAYSWLTSNQFNGKQDDVKNQEYCQTWSKDDKGDKQIISIDPQRGQNVVTYKLPDAKLDRPKRRESWNRIHISNKDCGGSRLNEQTTVQKDTETMVWELNLTSRKVEFSYPERQVFWPHKTSYEMTGDKSRSEALVFCPRKIIDHHRNGSNFIEITESSLGQDNLLRRNSSSSLDTLSQDANLLTENKQNKAKQGLNEMS